MADDDSEKGGIWGDSGSRYGRDENRLDDRYDRRPGGVFSKRYAEAYDPDGDLEFSPTGMENQNMLELAQAQRNAAARARGYGGGYAPPPPMEWDKVGAFVIPAENTFAAHLALIRADADLAFDPATHLFDRVLAESAGRPEFFDPRHPQYGRYQALRENFAVLRNDIEGIYMRDGRADPEDESCIPALKAVARELGEAMAAEKSGLGALLRPWLDTELLNMEGDGATHAYSLLLKRQRDPKILPQVQREIRGLLGMQQREWQLPPIEETPFSQAGLSAPAAAGEGDIGPLGAVQRDRREMEGQGDKTPKAPVNALEQDALAQAAQDGKTIYEWLKNVKFNDKSVQEIIDTGTPQERQEVLTAVPTILGHFNDMRARGLARDPNLADDPGMQEADAAAGVLKHSISILAALEKVTSQNQSQQISTGITEQPERWSELASHSVERLVKLVNRGVQAALSAMDRKHDEQHHQEERVAEQNASLGAHMGAQNTNKKKRGWFSGFSGKGGQQQIALARALAIDDAAAGQGRFAEQERGDQALMAAIRRRNAAQQAEAKVAPADQEPSSAQGSASSLSGLNLDSAALRDLGRTLAAAGSEASRLAPDAAGDARGLNAPGQQQDGIVVGQGSNSASGNLSGDPMQRSNADRVRSTDPTRPAGSSGRSGGSRRRRE